MKNNNCKSNVPFKEKRAKWIFESEMVEKVLKVFPVQFENRNG
jgi:hypothetical protein